MKDHGRIARISRDETYEISFSKNKKHTTAIVCWCSPSAHDFLSKVARHPIQVPFSPSPEEPKPATKSRIRVF
jgi:hypothetical protein